MPASTATCSFCGAPGAYHFEGFLVCSACAAASTVEMDTERGEKHAVLVRAGVRHYLYTASTADESAQGQRARLLATRGTLGLIAKA